jgi:phosphatidylserine decarboxylase
VKTNFIGVLKASWIDELGTYRKGTRVGGIDFGKFSIVVPLQTDPALGTKYRISLEEEENDTKDR